MDDFERKAPRSALALYIKMYSKQRNQNQKGNNIITEAVKSWLSLSEAEKNEFSKKYKECKLLLRKKVANQLKNIKPYMKKKRETNWNKVSSDFIEDSDNISNSNLNCEQNESQTLEENNLKCDQNVLSTLKEHNLNFDQNLSQNCEENSIRGSPAHSFNYETNDIAETENMILPSEVVIHEPNPPTLLSGQQLFNMIQKEDSKTWAELLPAQRRRYQTAVLTIKKNYLKEYKTYLESMSTANLLEHYKNVKKELV